MPSRTTLERRAKKAREAAAAEDYDNVDPHADDIGDADIHDIGGADNDSVSVGMGAGTVQDLVVLDVVPMLNRCRPLTPGQCRCRHSARLVRIANPHDRTGYNIMSVVQLGNKI